MTIRLRLTLLYSGLLMVIIIIFGAAVYGIMDRTLRSHVDNNLLALLDEIEPAIRASIDEDGQMGRTPYTDLSSRSAGILVQFWQPGETYPSYYSPSLGTHDTPLDPRTLHIYTESYTNITMSDVNFRVITRPIYKGGRLVGHLEAAASLETVESATGRLFQIMVVGSVGALLLAFTLGYGLASRALRPISQIAQTAQNIVTSDDLGRRVPAGNPHDELGSLSKTINQMLERLEKLFTTQRRFIADISHELRTPVTAIQGNVELLRRFGNDPVSLEAIEKETKRMARLVGDLLLLAQAEVGHLSLMKTQVELDTLLLEMYNQARVLAQNRMEVRLGDIDHIVIEADSDRLKQLLLNLITNALKYTGDGGKLTLSMYRTDMWVEIAISDTGVGIPPEDLPHIFDRFYRVDKARSRHAGGAGLGLSIAKWIAEAHGGTIIASSEMGKGTTFIVRLPLPRSAETTPTSIDTSRAQSLSRRLARPR